MSCGNYHDDDILLIFLLEWLSCSRRVAVVARGDAVKPHVIRLAMKEHKDLLPQSVGREVYLRGQSAAERLVYRNTGRAYEVRLLLNPQIHISRKQGICKNDSAMRMKNKAPSNAFSSPR